MFANGCFSGVDDVGVGTEFAGSLGRTGGAFSGERSYARGVEGAGRRDMPARGGRRRPNDVPNLDEGRCKLLIQKALFGIAPLRKHDLCLLIASATSRLS